MGSFTGAAAILIVIQALKKYILDDMKGLPKWVTPALTLLLAMLLVVVFFNDLTWRQYIVKGLEVALMSMGAYSGQKAVRGK